MRKLIATSLFLAAAGGLFCAQPAEASPTPDAIAVQKFLKNHKSPLPWWTIAAFKEAHPDFDIAGYLTVIWCESSLGTTGGSARYNNPGNIKYMQGSDKFWHKLAVGKWLCPGQGWYNRYLDIYTGQRAAIRLIYDSKYHYNTLLAAHDWEGFAAIYYGEKVAGLAQYTANLEAAHALIVREAARYGVSW